MKQKEDLNMNKPKFSDTTLFILPMYGLPIKVYDDVGFLDSFVKMEGKEQEEEENDYCYLLFFDAPLYDKGLEELITMLDNIVVDVIKSYKKLIIIVLKIRPEFKEDYYKILQGKYSKLSELYKELVSDKPSRKGKDGNTRRAISDIGKRLQLMVIEKDPNAKVMIEHLYNGINLDFANEYWKMFEIKKETLTQEKIKEFQKTKIIARKW